jgi:hypothetical protein
LPANELGKGPVAYVITRLQIETGGRLQLRFNSLQGLSLCHDGQAHRIAGPVMLDVKPGPYNFVLRINRKERGDCGLRVELAVPSGSATEAIPVTIP